MRTCIHFAVWSSLMERQEVRLQTPLLAPAAATTKAGAWREGWDDGPMVWGRCEEMANARRARAVSWDLAIADQIAATLAPRTKRELSLLRICSLHPTFGRILDGQDHRSPSPTATIQGSFLFFLDTTQHF